MLFDNLRDKEAQYKQELTTQDKAAERIIQEVGSFFGTDITGARKNSEFLKAATGWVYGCVNAVADYIAGIQIRLMRVKQNGEVEEVKNHPALDLIYRANNATTYFDLVKLTFQFMELTGEAPWFVSFKANKPSQIVILRPDRLSIIPGENGQEMIKGYKYRVYDANGAMKEMTLEPFEIIPLRYPNPDLPLRGLGPLQAAAQTVDLDDNSQSWNTTFYKNAAAPSLALETDKVLSQEVKDKLASKIRENYEGVRNAHKTMILEAGIKAKSISISQKDMDFIEQQRFSRDKIMSIFRVPKTILGQTEEVNRATAEAAEYVFSKYTVKPKLEGFIQQLNEFLLPLFDKTGSLYFDYDDPVPANVELKVTQAQTGVASGYMTVNEARELFGMDPIEGGDVLREPVSFNPLLQENGVALKGKPKKKNVPKQQRLAATSANRNTRLKNYVIIQQVAKTLEDKMTQMVYGILKKKKEKVIKKKQSTKFFTGDEKQQKVQKLEFQAKQLDVADEYEPKFIQKLNKVFEAQKKDILERISENMNADKGILDVDEERLRYESTLKSTFMGLLRKQSDQALALVGQKKVKAVSLNKVLEQYFAARTFRFAGEVTRNTNRLVGESLRAGISAGESVPKLRSRVSQLFENMEDYRADRIARSETIRATNFAAEQAWVDSGVVEGKEWVAFRDERTDDECIEMDGKTMPLGDNFFNKGDKLGGIQFDYEKIQYPPLHVNCRCTLVPIVFPAGQSGEWRASMSRNLAEQFVADSVYKGTLFHGTNDSAALNIQQNGFNLSQGYGGITDGIFFTNEKNRATDYAMSATGARGGKPAILQAKIKVKNLKEFSWHGLYDFVAKKLGSNFGPNDIKNLLIREGIDAVRITDEVVGQTYIAVFDPKNVVVIKP